MSTQTNKVKVSLTMQKKLSITVGLLSFVAFVVQGLGTTWGFEPVAKQIVQTFLLVSGGINIWFLGSTTQKITDEGGENENKK